MPGKRPAHAWSAASPSAGCAARKAVSALAENPTDEWRKACFSLLRNSFQIQADENATGSRMVPAAFLVVAPFCHEVPHPITLRARGDDAPLERGDSAHGARGRRLPQASGDPGGIAFLGQRADIRGSGEARPLPEEGSPRTRGPQVLPSRSS